MFIVLPPFQTLTVSTNSLPSAEHLPPPVEFTIFFQLFTSSTLFHVRHSYIIPTQLKSKARYIFLIGLFCSYLPDMAGIFWVAPYPKSETLSIELRGRAIFSIIL
jgi:hypothetical protein